MVYCPPLFPSVRQLYPYLRAHAMSPSMNWVPTSYVQPYTLKPHYTTLTQTGAPSMGTNPPVAQELTHAI